MRSLIWALVICFVSLSAVASEIINKEDSITLTRDKKDYVLKAGKEITMEIPLYIGDFFKETVIKATGKLKNTTDKDLKIIYVVSFYDKDAKLIGAATGNCHLAPQKSTYWGSRSAVIKGYEEQFKKVTSYKLHAFTFEVPPEKKK
jgi:hypothetical protein